jgi:hypothetical protein
LLLESSCQIITATNGRLFEVSETFFRGEKMTPDNSRSTQTPVFTVSNSRQEEVCKEVYDYLVLKKIEKLKEAILRFNEIIKKLAQ